MSKMPKRRTPVKHQVSDYTRKNGTRVGAHGRGSGTRSRRPSRVVGKVENNSQFEKEMQEQDLIYAKLSYGRYIEINDEIEWQEYIIKNEDGTYTSSDVSDAKKWAKSLRKEQSEMLKNIQVTGVTTIKEFEEKYL